MTKISYPNKILVLGASGLIGGALFTALKNHGVSVTGTARKEAHGLLAFDSARPGSIALFPWKDFDAVVDCTGVIQYDATPTAQEANREGNVQTPLKIIKQLSSTQQYFYCSTHAVLASGNERTTYAASKSLFEERILCAEDISAKVTIVRLPAIFSELRGDGFIHSIKEHFLHKKKLELSIQTTVWHAMYLSRVAEVFSQLVLSAPEERIITIGYPTEISFEKIISVAESVFGYSIPIQITSLATDHYVPMLENQNKYIQLEADNFATDLKAYLKK